MTDIVERLRKRQGFYDRGVCVGEDTDIKEAADEIERLRALVKDLADDLEAELDRRAPALKDTKP